LTFTSPNIILYSQDDSFRQQVVDKNPPQRSNLLQVVDNKGDAIRQQPADELEDHPNIGWQNSCPTI
jgi:hypothetical protein